MDVEQILSKVTLILSFFGGHLFGSNLLRWWIDTLWQNKKQVSLVRKSNTEFFMLRTLEKKSIVTWKKRQKMANIYRFWVLSCRRKTICHFSSEAQKGIRLRLCQTFLMLSPDLRLLFFVLFHMPSIIPKTRGGRGLGVGATDRPLS